MAVIGKTRPLSCGSCRGERLRHEQRQRVAQREEEEATFTRLNSENFGYDALGDMKISHTGAVEPGRNHAFTKTTTDSWFVSWGVSNRGMCSIRFQYACPEWSGWG